MNFNNIYLFAIIIFFCPLIGRIVVKSIELYKLSNEYHNGNSLLNSLVRLTSKEFQIWCGEYLAYLGYGNIIFSNTSQSSSNYDDSIICTLDNISYLVQCENLSKDNIITDKYIENIFGILISKSLYNGILITTSSVSSETLNFAESLPTPYNIKIITLNNIIAEEIGQYPLQLNDLK